jgi:hypothetical protein
VFASAKHSAFTKAILVMAVGGFLVKAALDWRLAEHSAFARSPGERRGEYGGDLSFLGRYHVKPHRPTESNHYIDLWSPGELPTLARVNGLTNNRALFIDSHGRSGFRWHGRGYALYPRETLVRENERTPYFSARDVASILGKETAATIHNIVIAGCNEDGQFRSSEWRRHFVNATNITYMTPGKLSFKPMFYQAIVSRSTDIRPCFGKLRRVGERIDCDIEQAASPGTEELGAYVADLYLPGGRKPYRTQRAGRELLEPEPAVAATAILRADKTPSTTR